MEQIKLKKCKLIHSYIKGKIYELYSKTEYKNVEWNVGDTRHFSQRHMWYI